MNKQRLWIASASVIAAAVFIWIGVTVWNEIFSHRPEESNGELRNIAQEELNQSEIDHLPPSEPAEPEPQYGQVKIVNTDALTNHPVFDAAYELLEADTGEVIEVIRTNLDGEAVSSLLEFGTTIVVAQQHAPLPYNLDDDQVRLQIESDIHTITRTSEPRDFVKEYYVNEDGTTTITHLHLPMVSVLQNPELPNGCEITSLTAILQSYGYDVSKTVMADVYLEQIPFSRKDGKLYGADPYLAYAGNPRHARSGFFVYGPPIVDAAHKYFADVGGTHEALDISGSSREEIMSYLYDGYPVLMWVTLNLEKSRINYSWYIYDTDEFFPAPVNLHAVVLHGFNGDELYVMDPLRGLITRDADEFFASYDDLGSHAVVVM